jgi:putative spermidine/putrescine transport system ATP-binding protein
MSQGSMVRLVGLRKTFGEVIAVDDVSLEVRDGEFLTLLGPSGSGKTTVLRMLAGFERPDAGSIFLDGEEVTELPPYRRNVNTVFQDYALFPHMSVLDNIEYGLRVKGVSRAEARTRALEALAQVRLPGFEDRKPSQLSGGQRQRVALARALVNRPKVLLLDEPLGALDLKLREQMQIELKQLQRDVGITFIFVTHDQEEALTMSDRIAIFSEGRIAQLGTPREVYEHPQTRFVSEFVGQTNKVTAEQAAGAGLGASAFNIRPEYISLHRTEAVGDRRLAGTIKDVIFIGAQTRYLVDTPAGVIIAVSPTTTQDFALGDDVKVSWSTTREHHIS